MDKLIPSVVFMLLLFTQGTWAQTPEKEQLTADAFQLKIAQTPDAQLIDVRTPAEFKKNHIKGALNINVNGGEFKDQVAVLDKTKPVLVYCLSGGRSASAAAYLRKNGFRKVYEMDGGMVQWMGQNKPYETSGVTSPGMTQEQFNKQVAATDHLVLVDFNARWCAPCKKMAPWLEALSKQYAGKMTLLKIDADDNAQLLKAMNIEILPALILYKNGKPVWQQNGLVEKNVIEKNITANQ